MRVFATARNLNSITDLQDLGIECFSLVVDDPASVQKCYEEVSQLIDFAGLDYLVNNAGRSTWNTYTPIAVTDSATPLPKH